MKNNLTSNLPVITIDGTSGSGKGTVSMLVAKELGWHYLDSGALYRVLAYFAQLKGIITPDQEQDLNLISPKIVELANNLPVEFKQLKADQPVAIYLAGELVNSQIRTEKSGLIASKIAALPAIRTALLARQRNFLQEPGLVADGRDMGTVVFPTALAKFFLHATIEEQAKRRYNQLKGIGLDGNLQDLMVEITKRDQQDRNRAVAPTKPAADALVIDTSTLSIAEVFTKVMNIIKGRL